MASTCGYDVTVRDHTDSLAGGGTEAVFYDDGSETDQIDPPAGFDPTTATNSQLEEYGFPLPSTDQTSVAYSDWEAEVSGISFSANQSFTVGPPLYSLSAQDAFSGRRQARRNVVYSM